MRLFARRSWLGVVALVAGMGVLHSTYAAEIVDDEYKALIAQDLKALNKAVAAYDKAATDKDKKALVAKSANSVRSTAVLIAFYANARATGKDGAAMASVRDSAIKLAKAAGEKDYKDLAALTKAIETPKAGDAKAESIDVLKALDKVSIDDTMYNFKKLVSYGSGAEEAIKANSKKVVASQIETAAIAQRVIALAEMSKTVVGGSNDAEKKEWVSIAEEMDKAGKALHAASKKKTTPADLAKAFLAVDASCTKCHNKFKN
jgi:hypothetical protein